MKIATIIVRTLMGLLFLSFSAFKQALREVVADTSARMSVTELISGSGRIHRIVERQAEMLRRMKA